MTELLLILKLSHSVLGSQIGIRLDIYHAETVPGGGVIIADFEDVGRIV